MKTQFDKIYVLSLITNKDRQEFIKYQFDKLGLEFEFIYGIDFYNFENIEYPDVLSLYPELLKNLARNYGCTMTHYQAIMQAYYLNCDNVLIIEDDLCLNTDALLFEDMLNNIPDDADFVTYDYRFNLSTETILKRKIYDNIDKRYVKLDNEYSFFGAAMYGIMNRKTMELYLHNQRENLVMSDHVNDFWKYNPNSHTSLIKYAPTKCLSISQEFYKKIFIKRNIVYKPCYDNPFFRVHSANLNEFNFFRPEKFHEWSRI